MRRANRQGVRAELVGQPYADLLTSDARVQDLPDRLAGERRWIRRRERVNRLRTGRPRADPLIAVVAGLHVLRRQAERRAEQGGCNRAEVASACQSRADGEPRAQELLHGCLLVWN